MDWRGGLELFKTGFGNICSYEGDGPRKMRFLGAPTVLVRAHDHIKMLLNGDEGLVGVAWPAATRALLGPRSVTFATGAYHRSLRRLLGPCFAPQAIEAYLPAIQALCERYCDSWADATTRAAAAKGAKAGAGAAGVELLPKLQKGARLLTFEVMATVVAGFAFTPQQLDVLSDAFEELMAGIFHPLALAIPGTPFARACAARRVMVAALDEQFESFTATGGGGREDGSVMARLMGMKGDDGQPLSRQALQELAINLLFAGHETTSSSIVRLMLLLRTRPDVVSKLRSEQAVAVEAHGQDISGAALRAMPYLDAVVKEAWRVNPLVPIVPRRAVKDFSLGGYDVPKGWTLYLGLTEPLKEVPAWSGLAAGDPLHPAAFNPDRWRPAAGPAAGDASAGPALPPGFLSSPLGLLPPAMLTFGGGTRYCLGAHLAWAEIKAFLAVLVRQYDFRAALEHMEVKEFPTITVSDGFPIQVLPLSEPVAAA